MTKTNENLKIISSLNSSNAISLKQHDSDSNIITAITSTDSKLNKFGKVVDSTKKIDANNYNMAEHNENTTKKKAEPLVSVLIPSFNHAKYITETVNSIIDQTYKNIELLILDDGSSDDTDIKVNTLRLKCEARFARFQFQKKPNEGVCLTLNKLITESMGEYIFVIASDDMAKPTIIEKEVNFLEEPINAAYSLVVCDNAIIDKNSVECFWGEGRRCVYNKKEAKFLTFGNYLQILQGINFKGAEFGKYENLYLKGNHIPNGYLIRKSILEMTGLYNPKAPLEDYYLMLQLSKYGLFKYIDEPLFCYRWHDFNTIKNSYKITKMAIATEKIEDDILAKINVNDPALLRNVILFKHKYDQSLVYKIHNILRKQKTILKLLGYEIMHFLQQPIKKNSNKSNTKSCLTKSDIVKS